MPWPYRAALPAARTAHQSGQPGVGARHDVYSNGKGFVYLTAAVDWASRKVVASTVAITLEACHAVDVLQDAFTRHGKPEIVNTDQGSQFTAQAFVQAVKDGGCHLSMDGRGAWRDNVFVERLWKSVKYERVYLHAYDSVTEARQSIMQ